MKLRITRFSGLPVDPETLKAYEAEFATNYDAIVAEHAQDMLTVHEKLKELDGVLQQKYGNILDEELPKSKRAWLNLLAKFDAPIMLARSSENPNELLFVVMDQPLV